MTAPAALRHRQAALISLDAAAALGDCASAWAACILRGTVKAGRPAMDDAAAVRQIEAMRAVHGRKAASIVASALSAGANTASVAHRLRRKASIRT
jgi:hypothetical protein